MSEAKKKPHPPQMGGERGGWMDGWIDGKTHYAFQNFADDDDDDEDRGDEDEDQEAVIYIYILPSVYHPPLPSLVCQNFLFFVGCIFPRVGRGRIHPERVFQFLAMASAGKKSYNSSSIVVHMAQMHPRPISSEWANLLIFFSCDYTTASSALHPLQSFDF